MELPLQLGISYSLILELFLEVSAMEKNIHRQNDKRKKGLLGTNRIKTVLKEVLPPWSVTLVHGLFHISCEIT